jgi:hypothetical protein
MAKATLYLGKLTAEHTTAESNKDDVFMHIYVDGAEARRWPDNNGTIQMGDGGVVETDVALNVDYNSTVWIEVKERDTKNDGNYTLAGRYDIDRRSPASATLRSDIGPKNTCYTLAYRLITNPIPTVRILGIKCEKQTDDMDGETSGAILGAVGACCDAAGNIIKKSPRPRAKVIGGAFKEAGKVLDAIELVAGWLARKIEGKDDVYMVHFTPDEASKDINGRFFPKQNEDQTCHMAAGDEVFFEERYGEYFRFPVDKDDVTIEFREHDSVGKDISICTVTIPRVTSDTDPRLTNPAVEQVADTYDLRGDKKGGVYHLCYSVGMEDWANPGNADEQGELFPPTSDTWGDCTRLDGDFLITSSPAIATLGDQDLMILTGVGDVHVPLPGTNGAEMVCHPCVYQLSVRGTWSGVWLPVGPNLATPPAAVRAPSGQIHTACVDPFGAGQYQVFAAGRWVSKNHAPVGASGYALACWSDERLDAFALGGQGQLMHSVFTQGWSSWVSLGGEGTYEPAAVSWGENRIDVVVRSTDGELWHIAWDGSRWTEWVNTGGGVIRSAPSLTSRGPGRLDCVARGTGNHVIHRVFADGVWGDWYDINNGQEIKGTPAVNASGNNRLDLVFWGSDGFAWKTSLQPGM